MADDTEPQIAEGQKSNAEMWAINEKLVITAVQQQEIAEHAVLNAENAWKSGELYRLLVKHFPNGMVLLFDHDLRHRLADGGGLLSLGLSKASLEGSTIWEGFSPDVCRQIEPAYRAALLGETTLLEVRFDGGSLSPKAGERIYQMQTLPIWAEQGNVLTGMVVAQDVTEQRQLEESIRRQAHHDSLTGLPNRALLRDRLDQALAMAQRSGEFVAVLFLDMDRFKFINDTWGHDAGDRVLEAVAMRLTDCLRVEDTVARVGGDEFVVLLPSLQVAEYAAGVAEKIMSAVSAPLMIKGHEMSVIASVGISLFPTDGQDAHALLNKADTAMYKVKKARPAVPVETKKRPV